MILIEQEIMGLLGSDFTFPSTDHSFFGTEWQKRWCALSHHIFYYYGSEKGNVSFPVIHHTHLVIFQGVFVPEALQLLYLNR